LPKDATGIISPWFSYVANTSNGLLYNICFEVAECDLKTYLSRDANFPAGDSFKRSENVQHMFKLAGGLKWLADHITEHSGKFGRQAIWHLDLHWANVLVCRDPRAFKISDFGGAVRRIDCGQKQRSRYTRRTNLSGAFSAPELDPTATSDVWSFGCILLLVIIFNYEGVGGLNEFNASLLRHANVDCFYEKTTGRANQEVVSCIEHLRRRIDKESDRLVTTGLLDLLQKDILVPVKQRKDICQIEGTIMACIDKRDTVEPKIRVQRSLGKGKPYHHCVHSPGAGFEIFHGDTYGYTMNVWTWRQGVAAQLPLLEPISVPRQTLETSQVERIYTRSSSCAMEYVCQVVASCNPLEVSIVHLTLR
jgi:serine/threonine protein kinase